jgi:hypothetical protein
MVPSKSSRKRAKTRSNADSNKENASHMANASSSSVGNNNRGGGARSRKNVEPRGGDEEKNDTSNDAHERAWWTTHIAEAAKLIERCAKVCRWDVSESKRVFDSYRQFLMLKKEVEDCDGSKLVPCWPIEVMWDEHCQMEDYDYHMKGLIGHVIERRASFLGGSMTDASKTERAAARLAEDKERARLERSTRDALKRRFGSRHDDELWAAVSLSIVDQFGVETTLEVNRREPLINLFVWYAGYKILKTDKYVGLEDYRFAYAGKIVTLGKDVDRFEDDLFDDTPQSLGFDGHARIEANLIDMVAFTIRYSSDRERAFLVEKTSMMKRAFETFANDVMPDDTKLSDLIFNLGDDGQRVYGYESPVALRLKPRNNEVIRAVDAASHRCENCIRCNPRLVDARERHVDNNYGGVQDDDSSDDTSVASA